jgi:hypothetical protein
MKIKITLRFHPIPVTMVIIKNRNKNKCCEDVGEKRLSYTVGRNVN